MAIERARGPFVWTRRILLVLGILVVVALVVMLGAYGFGTAGRDTTPTTSTPVAPEDADATVERGRGFDYTQTSEGRPVFRIRADRSRQDREGNAFLEEVILDLFHEDGQVYTVTSRSALFNQSQKLAELEGEVVLRGWEDLVLEARALDLGAGGQVLTSRGAVEFSYPPDLTGRASMLRVDRRSDTIILGDGVHLRSVPGAETPMRLDCEHLAYRRDGGLIRAQGDVFLRRGREEVSARAITMFLEEDQSIQSMRARWEVSGRVETEDDRGQTLTVTFRAELVELQPVDGSPQARKVELEATEEDTVAEIRVVDDTGLARSLTGTYLVGYLDQGRPLLVEGYGDPLELVEALDMAEPYVLRQACSERAVARFLADGRIARVELESQVELRDREVQMSGGAHAALDLESGAIEIQGRAVELYSDRAQVLAPHFTYARDAGVIRARSGVQATLEAKALAGLGETPFGQGDGPVRVESQDASWTTAPPTFSFRGDVRAWRDQNLLLADQLRGDETSREMAASGDVKTVWIPRSPTADTPAPIEVTAESLTYREASRELIYDGRAEIHRGPQTLSCETLHVELTANGSRAERMICRDQVHLDDPTTGRKVEGDVAVYTLSQELMEVFGERVKLLDAEKNELIGRYLQYDVRAGTIQLRSHLPERAPGAISP